MEIVNSAEDLKKTIDSNKMVLVYFANNECNVCVNMKPKIEKLLQNYPKIRGIYVDIKKLLYISSNYMIFSIPALLIYVEGKKTIRQARHISIKDIDEKISRLYNLLFH